MPDPTVLLLVLTAFAAAGFLQGATGFGFGLLAMSVLPLVMDVRTAVPVVSVFGLLLSTVMLVCYRRHLSARRVLPILAGMILGIPLGVLFLTAVDPRWVTGTLGLLLVGYAGSTLARERRNRGDGPRGPRPLPGVRWGVVAGLFGGLFGGAFGTGGPPLLLYATARRWAPGAFKANLQACFVFTAGVQLALFLHEGMLTDEVLRLDLIGLPVLLLALAAGMRLSRRLDAARFRQAVLCLLLFFGVVFLVRTLVGFGA